MCLFPTTRVKIVLTRIGYSVNAVVPNCAHVASVTRCACCGQVVLPLWPGVESVVEPAREEVEDALEVVRDNVGEALESAEQRMGALRERFGARPH